MNKSYADFNGLLDNDYSGRKYYPTLKRTNDLANTRTNVIGKKFRQLEDLITPSTEPLDELVIDLMNDLSDKMLVLEKLPNQQDVVLNIDKWLDKNKPNPVEDSLKGYIQTNGLTGKLVTAAKKINTNLDRVDRHLLSKDGLFFYCAYRAIGGFDVKDVDGIVANMMASLDKIKNYINKNLVKVVLKKQNITADPNVETELEEKISKRSISYEVGRVIPTIMAEFNLINDQGKLIKIVREFIDKNKGVVPLGVNESDFISQMVQYLFSIGYEPEPDEIGPIKTRLGIAENDLKVTKADIDTAKTNFEKTKVDLENKIKASDTALETAKTDLGNQVETAKNDLNAAKTSLETTNKDLEATKASFENTKTDLENKITDSNAALETAKTDLTTQIADSKKDLEEKLNEAKEECGEKCIEKCVEVESNMKDNLGTLSDQLKNALNEIADLKTQIIKLETSNPKADEFQNELNIVKVRLGNNLREIEGIGATNVKKLIRSGIDTFEKLAALNKDELLNIIPKTGRGTTHQDVIDQAQFIVDCDYKKLKELQDEIPRPPQIN